MKHLLFYFFALFVVFYACTQEDNSTQTPNSTSENTASNSDPNTPVVPQAIQPKDVQNEDLNIKVVKQAPKSDLTYPSKYLDFGIPQFKGSIIENNVMIDNSNGMYGQRVKLKSQAAYQEVFDFYAQQLIKNGWTKDDKMDKTVTDEDIVFFRTNYKKDNYTLGYNIIDLAGTGVSITLILKEN